MQRIENAFVPERETAMLFPAETVYLHLMQRRRKRFEAAPVRIEGCRVVSIGNLTTGGTGKTPCVQWVARHYQNRGARVAIVARGYGGALSKKGAIVSDGTTIFHDAREVGDEPLLHARALPSVAVVIGRDRIEAVRRAVGECKAQVAVLDDGFQFWSLWRDCDLVLLDSRRPFGNRHLLPCGRLREEPAALRRATAMVLTRADAATAEQLQATRAQVRLYSDAPLFEARHAPVELRRVEPKNTDSKSADARDKNPRGNPASANAKNAIEKSTRAKNIVASGAKSLGASDAKSLGASDAKSLGASGALPLESLRGARVVAMSALADNAGFGETLRGLGADVVSHIARRDHHAWRESEVRGAAQLAQASEAMLLTTEKDAVKMRFDSLPVALWSLVIALEISAGEEELRSMLDRIIA